MAKFCANCGAQLEDGDKVCGQCGTPVNGAAPAPAAASTGTGTDAGKAKSGNKIFIIAAAAIVLIVVAVIVVNIAGNYTGYKGTLNKMVKALQEDDVATLESLGSSISEEMYSAWYGDDYFDYYDDIVSNALDKYEDSVGNIKKISYEITDETEFSDRRLDELDENLIDRYNMDTSGIKKIIKVNLKITVKGNKKSSVYNVDSLYMIKESGGWKIHYGSLSF